LGEGVMHFWFAQTQMRCLLNCADDRASGMFNPGKTMKFDDLKALPPSERLLALEVLWQSLAQTPEPDRVPEWHRQVLSARLHKLQAGLGASKPWSQAKKQLQILTTSSH
jgi:putative addiction module component (TIGR02574 family)